MAAVLNFDQQTAPSRAAAAAAMAVVVEHCQSLPALSAVPRIAGFRAQLDAVEATALATAVGSNGDTKTAERIASKGGRTSKRARRRSAKRAAAVKKNAGLAAKMAAGEMSGEQVDVLADAASRTDGASLVDNDLIDAVAAVNPDLGKGVIDAYLRNKGADQAQTRHDKQRAKRRVSRFTTKDDCEAILIAGDKATIDRIWNATTRKANAFYQQDGGRELPIEQHPRTYDHRMFDAITGVLSGDDETASDNTTANAATSHTGDVGNPGHSRSRSSRRHTPRTTSSRPTVVIGVTLEKWAGLDPDQAAELIGTGPIADSVLADYLAADPNIVGAVFGTHGQPLWLGRNVRLASYAQTTALIVRDKGCVLCGAHPDQCKAHHTMPWNAPVKGETDITKLVLVCDSCHHLIHDNQLTISQDRKTRRWLLRPALAHEIPPPRPPRPARAQGPQRT